MKTVVVPQTYPEWRYCIEVLCQTPLTPAYVDTRIEELTSLKNHLDQRFVQLYGEQHRTKVLTWFKQVRDEKLYSKDK